MVVRRNSLVCVLALGMVLGLLPSASSVGVVVTSGWQTPHLIELSDGGDAWLPRIVMDDSGNGIAVWNQFAGSYSHIWACRFVAGSGWQTPELIEAAQDTAAIYPAIDMDYSGNAICAWSEATATGYHIMSNRYEVGIGWGSPEPIESLPGNGFVPKIGIDGYGNALVVWQQRTSLSGIWSNRYVAGVGWGEAVPVESLPGDHWSPALAVDIQGNGVVVWNTEDSIPRYIWASRYQAGLGWSVPQKLQSVIGDAVWKDVGIDSSGNAIAVWEQYTDNEGVRIFSNRYVVGAGWGTAVAIDLENNFAGIPRIAVDNSGNAIVVFSETVPSGPTYDDTVFTNRYVVDQGWGTPERIETLVGDTDSVDVATNNRGDWITTWCIYDGTYFNLRSSYLPAAGTWSEPQFVEDNPGSCAFSAGLRVSSIWLGDDGNAMVVWRQFDGAFFSVYANQYITSTPGTHDVIKGAQGPRASAVTWEYAPSDYGTWTGRIVNNGLRSLLVDVYDITTGVSEEIMNQKIRFAANDAYPSGEVNTSGVVMSPMHRYMITVTPNGPQGSSCMVQDMFLRPQSPPVASFTVFPLSGNTATVFTFDASGSSDAETPLSDLQVRWDWENDGVWDTAWSTVKQIDNQFASPGTYTVCLEVMDTDGLIGVASKDVVVSNATPPKTSIVYTAYDFFQEPWGEWYWNPDWRWGYYAQDYILSNTTGQYVQLKDPSQSGQQGIIYAPYRFNMTATSVSTVDVHNPEFMPVLGGVGPQAGAEAEMHIRMQYLDNAWWWSYWMPQFGGGNPFLGPYLNWSNDGYLLGVIYDVELNREAAYEWMGMPTADDPVTWWAANQDSYDYQWDSWVINEGNNRLDIFCGYEDYYYSQRLWTNMSVDTDGDILLRISHVSWGYEVLMTRWLTESQLCTHEPWFEDFDLQATYGNGIANVTFDAVAQYGFHAVKANASAGNDGAWALEFVHVDYWPSWSQAPAIHPSEYDLYVGPSWGGTTTYQSWNSGDPKFGQKVEYDSTPRRFNLNEFQTLIVKLPQGSNVPGYLGQGVGPNAIRNMSFGDSHDFDALRYTGTASIGYVITNPANPLDIQSLYDPITKTLTITGPYDFDNPGGRGGGMLYHGAPWIEFNVSSTLKTESVVEATPEPGVESAPAATAEMLSVAVVTSGVVIAVPALIGTRRWDE